VSDFAHLFLFRSNRDFSILITFLAAGADEKSCPRRRRPAQLEV